MVIIGGMVAILLHERSRVLEIEAETQIIHKVQHNVNIAHRYITILAMRGETALAWEKEDFVDYHLLRLRVDSMYKGNEEFVYLSRLDTLCYLLESKEENLHQIMQLFQKQDSSDGLLLTRLPEETCSKTIIRKKKGIAWKSHSTLTLLATQDLPTFLYYMIDPLKSWCWGAILFYPFKNSRFS